MSIENVKAHFRKWDMENHVLEFSVSSATVTEAALALHTDEQRIVKNSSFMWMSSDSYRHCRRCPC